MIIFDDGQIVMLIVEAKRALWKKKRKKNISMDRDLGGLG